MIENNAAPFIYRRIRYTIEIIQSIALIYFDYVLCQIFIIQNWYLKQQINKYNVYTYI